MSIVTHSNHFQIASNYATFFDKLTEILGRLTNEFPYYGEIVQQYKNSPMPNRLKKSITDIYTSLLRFLQSLLRVFTKNDGST